MDRIGCNTPSSKRDDTSTPIFASSKACLSGAPGTSNNAFKRIEVAIISFVSKVVGNTTL